MIAFGSPQERMACLLHEARMTECYGNWTLPSRFRWPQDRETWEFYQHNPHSAVLQALAQAKAVLAAQGTEARRAETENTGSVHDGPVAESDAPNPHRSPTNAT